MWDFSSPTKDWAHTPCTGRWSLNHCTDKEVSFHSFCLSFLRNLYAIFYSGYTNLHSHQRTYACVHAQSLQLCPTLCNPMDCSPPGSFVHGIFQARILDLVAISSSRGSSPLRDQTQVSCISCTAGNSWHWAHGENQRKHAYNWITLPHNRNEHNILSQLYLNQKTNDPQGQIYVHNNSKLLFVSFTILTKTQMIQK